MKRNKVNIKKQINKKTSLSVSKKDVRKNIEIKYSKNFENKKNVNNVIIDSNSNQLPIYDVIIIIPTKDRYDNLCLMLNKLFNDESKYTFKIIILNDCSDDTNYNQISVNYPNIIYLTNEINYGKYKYWVTINKLFAEAQKYQFKHLIQIDDDFELCNMFINLVVRQCKKPTHKWHIWFLLTHESTLQKPKEPFFANARKDYQN